ncbi:amyloid fiber anchoring/assembly protein TapA [Sutcliffiella halmapala]|uniref:amyloid fiber anchoring/assembly protein TapA n=1 Tax=Sutcliffiella halmapala TaxID=79882 RepID=UPI0009952B46|nr:amyloid fiber anchoring/assembly protein TapA [Sutcliffiella halmapala]
MRYSRLNKFREKHKSLVIVLQICVIYYVSLISLSLLTSGTLAYFSDSSKANTVISTAPDWWDKSKLVFPDKGTQVVLSCPPIEISVGIKNEGLSMSQPTEYEVFYAKLTTNGNPSKYGDKIAEDQIYPIKEGKTSTLTFSAEEEGWYVFKALQRPGFENDYEDRKEIWSEKVKVQCKEDKKVEEEVKGIEEEVEVIEEDTDKDQGEVDEEVKEEDEVEEQPIESEPPSDEEPIEEDKEDENAETNEINSSIKTKKEDETESETDEVESSQGGE